jgi:predicted metalloprotease with PDZ domain
MNAYLGADLEQQGDRLVVTRVLAGTPAYEQGLYAGDQIVAVDGVRATRDFLNARLAEKQPNDSVTFAVFRADDLRNLTIKLGGRAEEFYRIVAVAQPSAAQARLYQEWMGAPLVQQR